VVNIGDMLSKPPPHQVNWLKSLHQTDRS
jgi:hypothetical protein